MEYQLICMSFDGEYQREAPMFSDIDSAWEHSNNIGSRWFFYPFHFVVSSQTIRATPDFLEQFTGRRIKTVKKAFNALSVTPDMQEANCDDFVLALQEPF